MRFGQARLRGVLRSTSASVLLTFVLCHLTNHALALVSLGLAKEAHEILLGPWRSGPGTVLLLTAALTHYGNALWSVYARRSLRLPAWQLWQLGLGLTIPLLLMKHLADTRLAEEILGTRPDYRLVLLHQWVLAPWLALLQAVMLLTLWTHAAVGLHFWLRSKRWYPGLRPWLLALAVLVPALALSGFVAAGNEIRRQAAADPAFAVVVLNAALIRPATPAAIDLIALWGWGIHLALALLPFAGRGLRQWRLRLVSPPLVGHPCGRRIAVAPGATLLEALQDAGIAHASVCGGRGRCTTCRVRVLDGLAALDPPNDLESRALARIDAAADIRLACQLRPRTPIGILPLLPAGIHATGGGLKGGQAGSEKVITVVFIDLRGSTILGEAKLPYDVLFILNQFFHEMTLALTETGGHYSNYTGDGLMALYGHDGDDPAGAARGAMAGAGQMLERLDALNRRLAGELPQPLRIGIGIHSGLALVGLMGPPAAQHVGAMGDTVNTTARLESLCKERGCPLIVSKAAADLAGLDQSAWALQRAMLKGKAQPVEYYALDGAPAAAG